MEIKTEKTHTIVLSDKELNSLRCFIEDALEDGIWYSIPDSFPDDRKEVEEFYEKAKKAVLGGSK